MEYPRGPLSGVIVADFSRVLAGPYATMMLADMGATVIKVERPGVGDDTRAWGPPFDTDGTATYFNSVNRNKTSRSIDLQTIEGRDEALEIISGADVIIENFRAGTMDRLGLGYDDLRDRFPRLVYCSITGFGTGEGAALPGYDLLVQAMGGLMSITGPDSESPTKVGVALVDVITGLHALGGILAALRHRDHHGEGQLVHTSLLASLLSALTNQASAYLGAGVVPTSLGNRHPSIAPYEVFETADRALSVAVGNDRQFRAMSQVRGIPELAQDPRFVTNTARVAHRELLSELLTRQLLTDRAAQWYDRLTAAGVPAGPVNSIDEAFAFAAELGLEPAVEIPGTAAPSTRNPLDFSATPIVYHRGPPPLDP